MKIVYKIETVWRSKPERWRLGTLDKFEGLNKTHNNGIFLATVEAQTQLIVYGFGNFP